MSVDAASIAAHYVQYIKAVQTQTRHEAHALRFARALNIRVRIGFSNRCTPDHPDGPLMVVQPWHYGNTDVVRHEEAHILLWWSGLEAEIVAEYGEELGWSVVENLCHQAVAFLQITQPMVGAAVKRHGVTAQAVRYLQKVSGADASTALRRLIYDDPAAERAGFMTSGSYIAEVAANNYGLPFWVFDRVPEPALLFPAGANATFARLPGGTRLVGVCGA